MNSETYILSASTKREAIIFKYHNFNAGKQSFSLSSVFANQLVEILLEIKKKCTSSLVIHMQVILPSKYYYYNNL